jgi:hypothetical protein
MREDAGREQARHDIIQPFPRSRVLSDKDGDRSKILARMLRTRVVTSGFDR